LQIIYLKKDITTTNSESETCKIITKIEKYTSFTKPIRDEKTLLFKLLEMAITFLNIQQEMKSIFLESTRNEKHIS